MVKSPIVVAVVGLCGTGKSEVVRIFREIVRFEIVYFGGVVIDEIKRRNMEVTEESESLVRTQLRTTHGMAAMAIVRLSQITAALEKNQSVLIDGLYSYSEYRFLETTLSKAPTLVAVHSRRDLRIARLGNRNVRPLSEAEMDARDRREIEQMEKAGPIAIADYHILNDGSVADLSAAVLVCSRNLMAREG